MIRELSEGGRRYQDLHDALDVISHKVLTDTFRRAERDGLITRYLDPSRVETATLYRLTDLGKSLDRPLSAIEQWVDANWDLVEASRRNWSTRSTRSKTRPGAGRSLSAQ